MSVSGTKKTKGRQKIEMKKIENDDDRLITFSKRRSGIYKKASELATLCGAEVGFIVFSPAGKPFSFGHPSIESVANRFLNQNPPPNDNTHPLVEAHRNIRINQLSHHWNELQTQLGAEKEKTKVLDQIVKGKETTGGWWQVSVDQLNLNDLNKQYSSLEQFCNNVYSKRNRNRVVVVSSSLTAPSMDHSQALTDPLILPYNSNDIIPSIFPSGFDHGRQHFLNNSN